MERLRGINNIVTKFLKGGADSPENFLGYFEFDQTPPSHKYQPHAADWHPGGRNK